MSDSFLELYSSFVIWAKVVNEMKINRTTNINVVLSIKTFIIYLIMEVKVKDLLNYSISSSVQISKYVLPGEMLENPPDNFIFKLSPETESIVSKVE